MKPMDPKEGAQFLLDSGLLFEINRRVLHPLGIALSVHCEEGTDNATGVFGVMRTADLEGLEFDETQFRGAMYRFRDYLLKEGALRLSTRELNLGFILQEEQHLGRPPRDVVSRYSELTDEQVRIDDTEVASGFVQLACACGQMFVRSVKRGTDWSCPLCHVEDGVEAMADDDGPERVLDKKETKT